eukprot:5487210-Pyramimonas_sp.AAC.1
MLIRFVAMWSRWSHRLSRQGKDRHGLPGTAGRAIFSCPALLARGSRGLCNNSGGRPAAVDFDNACSFHPNKFSEEAVPAFETQQERRETLTKLVAILVQLHPLPREAIASFCGKPHGESRVRPAETGRCGYSVKFHPIHS